MNLLKNPFHILLASVREDKRSLVARADYRASAIGEDTCNAALSDITAPRKRLAAEAAWLPGVEPLRAQKLMELFESKPAAIILVDKVSPLARANFLASALERMRDLDIGEITTWILELAREFSELDAHKVLEIINADRAEAGFTPAALSHVEAELDRRRKYCRSVIRATLCDLAFEDLVDAVSETIEAAVTSSQFSPLIEDTLDIYQAHVMPALKREEGSVFERIKEVREAAESDAADSDVSRLVNTLVRVVENWGYVAFPLMIASKERGKRSDQETKISTALRDLSSDMINGYGQIGVSRQIASVLQDVFDEKVEISLVSAPEESDPRVRFKRFGLRDGSFTNRGKAYALDDITSLAIHKSYLAQSSGEIEHVKLDIYLTGDRHTTLSAGGAKLFSYRSRERKIDDAIAFFLYLSSVTFDQRVERYEAEINERGFFEYAGCFFCPGEKVVMKGYDFKLASTDFVLKDGYVEMHVRRDGPSEEPRYMHGRPRFSTAIDTDVFTYLFKKHLGIDLSQFPHT